MFIEPNFKGDKKGWIEVICGSMFSGKTEELIRRLKRVKIANLRVEIFKPAIDVRYDEVKIVSHDTNSIHSTPVENAHAILLMSEGVDVVGIDEAQFFDEEIAFVCEQLALKGIRVIVAGLDMDYKGKPLPYPQRNGSKGSGIGAVRNDLEAHRGNPNGGSSSNLCHHSNCCRRRRL